MAKSMSPRLATADRRKRRIEDAIAHAEALPDVAAAALCGVSRATFWRRVKDGTFPPGFKIGSATRWRRSDLLRALDRAAQA